jgi:KaiC/GvpD/RAD55 family RecA-like ATPase
VTSNFLDLPGFAQAINKDIVDSPIILLLGPASAGKTLYCRKFLLDALALDSYAIFVSSDMTERQFQAMFSSLSPHMMENLKFLSIRKIISNSSEKWRSLFSDELAESTDPTIKAEQSAKKNNDDDGDSRAVTNADPKLLLLLLEQIQELLPDATDLHSDSKEHEVRLVFDSLSYLQQFFAERIIQKFVVALSSMLKDANSTAILVLSSVDTAVGIRSEFINVLISSTDGVIEIAIADDESEPYARRIRLASIRGHANNSNWMQYKIDEMGHLIFDKVEEPMAMICALCGNALKGKPIVYLDNTFDTASCLDTYKKLSKFYGSGISPSAGISADAAELHFFFIDIVGLSDPSLSVKRQMDKITTLNNLVKACPTFKSVPRDKKIVLPTGDGMAIGFLLNAELPLQLSIQLHKLLKSQNATNKSEDKLGVRIGISSGHVFLHNDINESQNVWGPGIILARRVMDVGDNLHILVEGNMAKGLMDLKDEYRACIKELCDYKIKHGQTIKIFSAYSRDFGNPELPTKLRQTE